MKISKPYMGETQGTIYLGAKFLFSCVPKVPSKYQVDVSGRWSHSKRQKSQGRKEWWVPNKTKTHQGKFYLILRHRNNPFVWCSSLQPCSSDSISPHTKVVDPLIGLHREPLLQLSEKALLLRYWRGKPHHLKLRKNLPCFLVLQ
jgi:hypothetical protein